MNAKYTWLIMPADEAGDRTDIGGLIGPSRFEEHESFGVVVTVGAEFRLLDASGEARYVGRIVGDYSGPEPLDDVGRGRGCTSIEYRKDGKWVSV